VSEVAVGETAKKYPVPGSTNLVEKQWESFRCRTCQRLLFKIGHDGQAGLVAEALNLLARLTSDERVTTADRDLLVAAMKRQRPLEIKCACKTMNYLMGA